MALLVAPAAANGAAIPPPGNSAVDQYTETFPGAGGNQESSSAPGTENPAKTFGSDTAQRFEQAGPDGTAAAAVAAATAPNGQAGRGADRGSPASASEPGAGGRSGAVEIVEHGLGTSGSGGMGLLFPLVLIAAVAGAAAFAFSRRRRTTVG